MTMIHHRIPLRYCHRFVSTYREYSHVNGEVKAWMKNNFEASSYRIKCCGSDSYLFSTTDNIMLFKITFP